ncbi:MAG: PrgI family protein [Patescibacteria group bacterium]
MPLQFTVPQFIDVEDKIFGPISVRQFVIILIGIGVVVMLYFVLTFTLFILAAPLACGVIAIFAFFKINGQHFHLFLLNVATTFRRPRIKLWHKHLDDDEIQEEKAKEKVGSEGGGPPKVTPTKSRLRELSLIVDTGGAYGEESWQVTRDIR